MYMPHTPLQSYRVSGGYRVFVFLLWICACLSPAPLPLPPSLHFRSPSVCLILFFIVLSIGVNTPPLLFLPSSCPLGVCLIALVVFLFVCFCFLSFAFCCYCCCCCPDTRLIDPLLGDVTAAASNILGLLYFATLYGLTGHLQVCLCLLFAVFARRFALFSFGCRGRGGEGGLCLILEVCTHVIYWRLCGQGRRGGGVCLILEVCT